MRRVVRVAAGRLLVTWLVALAALPMAYAVAAEATAATVPPWTPPAGSLPAGASAAYAEIQARDTFPGLSFATADDRADFFVQTRGRETFVRVDGDQTAYLDLTVPGQTGLVQPGHYEFGPDRPVTESFLFSLEGSGCGDGTGWIDVSSAVVVGGVLQHLELTMAMSCVANPTPWEFRLALRWDRSSPPASPYPVATPADLWAPPPGATPSTGNHVYLDGGVRSVAGEGVHVGTSVTVYQPPDDVVDPQKPIHFGAMASDGRSVVGTLAAGKNVDRLEVGYYPHVLGWDGNPVTGSLDLSNANRGCTTIDSWFAIDEITRVGTKVTHLAFRFGHRCTDEEGGLTLGSIDWTAAPKVTSLLPASGPRRGGTLVHIQGTDLVDVTSVTIAGVDAPITRDPYWDSLAVTVPPLPPGPHDVVVQAAGGPGTGVGAFTTTPNTPLAPYAPSVEPGPTSAVVSWFPPDELGDGPITGVRVDVRRRYSSDTVVASTTVAPDRTVALVPLHLQDAYVAVVTYLSGPGPGVPSPPSEPFNLTEPDVTPFDEVPTFVTQQYIDFAGRAPTTAERSTAVAAIRNRVTDADAWVADMRNRPEWGGARAPVIRIYDTYLHRMPNAGELALWAVALRKGTTVAAMSAYLTPTKDYQQRYAKLTNAQFVDRAYLDILRRPATAAGRTGWLNKMKKGMSRSAVLAGFSESTEHVVNTRPRVDATLLYTGLLRRPPRGTELPSAPGAKAAPTTVDPVALARKLLHSTAYANRF